MSRARAIINALVEGPLKLDTHRANSVLKVLQPYFYKENVNVEELNTKLRAYKTRISTFDELPNAHIDEMPPDGWEACMDSGHWMHINAEALDYYLRNPYRLKQIIHHELAHAAQAKAAHKQGRGKHFWADRRSKELGANAAAAAEYLKQEVPSKEIKDWLRKGRFAQSGIWMHHSKPKLLKQVYRQIYPH